MLIQPIPLILMPHTVQLSAYDSEKPGRYGSNYDDPITIQHVRVDDVSAIKFSKYAAQVDYQSMLYIDCITSNQLDVDGNEVDLAIVPHEQDKITLSEKDYKITKVNACQATGTVHHYECEMNAI